ncbi:MAG: glycosyltransferase [Oscillospiraceae bacterium]|jgi:Glycosyltransferases, probably involved in cell wall biogenesis|nr:glycosyltransferase [Oscillospiraceae bacterium]MBQ5523132.1 glycosyltransferase [Oscillospiraceae bacterium]
MKLSIIVPVYNTAGYLEQCVNSLLAQPIPEDDFEILLVNDGSIDQSLDVMQRFLIENPDIIEIIDTENGGQGRARNLALDVAQGDYIGFADSDDWVADDMYARLLTEAEETDADIAVCNAYSVSGSEQTVMNARPQGTDISAAGSVWNKIFRRSLVGNIRFPEGVWYEDFAFSAKLLLLSQKTVFLDEPLYYYRASHPSTMRNQNAVKNLDILTVMDDVAAFAGEKGKDAVDFFIINHILVDAIKRVNLQNSLDKKKVIRTLRDYVKVHIPDLDACKAYQAETRNRRLIMKLNYNGQEKLSQFILKAKSSVS